MHIEVLTEDSSGKALLQHLLPKLIGTKGEPHSWRVHNYHGIGHIPPGMKSADPAKRILLDQLPRVLAGYAKTPGIDAIVVVLDVDDRDWDRLSGRAARSCRCPRCGRQEPVPAGYRGNRSLVFRRPGCFAAAYPKARKTALKRFRQDTVCGTREMLADAVHPGGATAIRRTGWPLPGQMKHEWANRIGPLMNPDASRSPSFGKLRDGLRRLIAAATDNPAPAIQPGQTPAG
jgi:hypothetical protein